MDSADLSPADRRAAPHPARAWLLTVAACVATTLLATPLLEVLDLANIVMLFLLCVLLVAVRLGRNPAILASLLNVLLFDIFFVPPRFSLAVANIQYLVTFAVMLATGLLTAHLAAGLRQRAQEAKERERRTQALYGLASRLAGTLTLEQLVACAEEFIRDELRASAAILLPGPGIALAAVGGSRGPAVEPHLARVAYDSGEVVRRDELGGLGHAQLYLPLRASMRIRGVLAVRCGDEPAGPAAETVSLLQTLAALIAVAVERLHYVEVARQSELSMQAERLRSSILSALSHDLRTPLTAMVGLADSLFLVKPVLPPAALETAQALSEQAARLAGLVGNLLDMARLNAGEVKLRREWQPLEEVVGAALKLLAGALAGHRLQLELPRDLPLLEFDAVLIERVLCNLLENAAKYSPPGGTIRLAATLAGEAVELAVSDDGPGFPATGDDLFAMFVRGAGSGAQPGSGLGLAICRAIVEAHGGRIVAGNRPEGGACVRFTLPCGVPPVVEEEPL